MLPRAASAGLYTDFDQCLRQNGAPHQVLDLLSDYETSVSEQVTILRKLVKRVRPEQQKSVTCSEEKFYGVF